VGAEENIWTEEEGFNRAVRKFQDERAHDLSVLFTKC
jgi:hypothetical protein